MLHDWFILGGLSYYFKQSDAFSLQDASCAAH